MVEQTKAIATQVFSPEQEAERLRLLQDYKPHDKLVSWNAQGKTVVYYPAAWRLYELNLRYPVANFSSEVIHLDAAKNFCVVRARLYLGPDYESSPKKAEAHKQGLLSELDKVETKAMARCARNFGIGTEHALDMDDAEAVEVTSLPSTAPTNGNTRKVVDADPQPQANGHQAEEAQSSSIPSIKQLQARCTKLCGAGYWQAMLKVALKLADGTTLLDKDITIAHRLSIHKYLEYVDTNRPAAGGR